MFNLYFGSGSVHGPPHPPSSIQSLRALSDPPQSVPTKIPSAQLVEVVVEWPVELSEPVQNLWGDAGMGSALGLSQAARSAASLRLLQAREPFGLVEVEVFVRDDPLQTQEVLDPPHLSSRIGHQLLATHEQKMRQGEMLEPVLQVFGVQADAHGAPRGVDQAGGGVLQRQALEGRQTRVLGERLGVVGHGPGHGVPDHNDELGLAVHRTHTTWSFLCDKVTGGLLHGDLAIQRPRHQVPKGTQKRQR